MNSSPYISKPVAGYDQAIATAVRNDFGSSPFFAPEVRRASIPELQGMAKREALINALESRELEREVSPDIASIRQELPAQVLEDLREGPSTQLSNLWLRQGINDAIATGANLDGSFGRSAIADSTRRSYIADRDRVHSKAAGILAQNPEPQAGLDIGSLASLKSQTAADNASARDAWRAGLFSDLSTRRQDILSALQHAAAIKTGVNSNVANAINSARGANQAFWGNMAEAGGTTAALIASAAIAA